MTLRYLSVCSGIEAATQAWHGLGWQPVAFSEIEPFPCAVLAHHYPHVPNWGDMTRFQEWPDADVDVLCGGTPCQSFSVAGLRQGLADPRGNLMLTFGAIAGRYRPTWLVWENVPGVLSSNGGRDFGTFLGMLGQLGYGVAYRVLDAQHVRTCRFPRAVPQRRRRVFVVGYLGDWRRAAAVLFDRESLSGHPAPRREAGQGSAGRTAKSLAIRGRDGTPQVELGDEVANAILTPNGGRAGVGVGAALIQANSGDIGYCLTASAQQSLDAETETLIAVAHAFDWQSGGDARGLDPKPTAQLQRHQVPAVAHAFAIQERAVSENPEAGPQGKGIQEDHAYTLEARNKVQAVAFDLAQITSATNRTRVAPELPASTLNAAGQMHVATPWAVRRLTPRECERLQGFPDDFTRIPYRNKPADQCPDGPRYKALGNSWAVNVAEWVGERIAEVDAWEMAA
jgi:DNA (cytosine-5)-methyltransferase 1